MKTSSAYTPHPHLDLHRTPQGSLTPPPGNPAPEMKSLQEFGDKIGGLEGKVEARTAIPKSPDIPVPGPHFTISVLGSYHPTGNITVFTGDAILITAPCAVSIDLHGFTISSTLTGSFYIATARGQVRNRENCGCASVAEPRYFGGQFSLPLLPSSTMLRSPSLESGVRR